MESMTSQEVQTNQEKMKVKEVDVIVTGNADKPYFEIKWVTMDDEVKIGYGSYDLKNVFGWKKQFFEVEK